MERSASADELANWRFLMGLHRAYYDAYTRRRLIHETEYELVALDALRQSRNSGALAAIAEAQRVLDQGAKSPRGHGMARTDRRAGGSVV
jgi:hypothetical protein